MEMKPTLQAALEAATAKGDAVIAAVIQDGLTILDMTEREYFTTGSPNVEHVIAHLGRALTNLTRNSLVRAYFPAGTSSSAGGVTPRGTVIAKTIELFKEANTAQSDAARTALDDQAGMLALVDQAVTESDLRDFYTELQKDEFRVKILVTDVRKGLADFVPAKSKAVRTKAEKKPSPRQQTIDLAAPFIASSYGKFPVDNGDLASFIVESLDGQDALLTYWNELPEFNKLLVYADVRKSLTKNHNIAAPTKNVPPGVESASTPAADKPEKVKPARKSKAQKLAEAAAAANFDNDALFEEAVASALDLYGDGDEQEIRNRMVRIAVDGGSHVISWIEKDRIEYGEDAAHGTIINSSPDTHFVLVDEE